MDARRRASIVAPARSRVRYPHLTNPFAESLGERASARLVTHAVIEPRCLSAREHHAHAIRRIGTKEGRSSGSRIDPWMGHTARLRPAVPTTIEGAGRDPWVPDSAVQVRFCRGDH
jgi:hypothetical protein